MNFVAQTTSLVFFLIIATQSLWAALDPDEFFLPYKKKAWHTLERCLKFYKAPQQKHMTIMVLSYNNAAFYKKNLSSIFAQRYDNYSVIYVDDASTDATAALVEQHVAAAGQQKRFKLIRHQTRQRALQGFFDVLDEVDPASILVTLDGDDWFAHPDALALINKVYCLGDPAYAGQRARFLNRISQKYPMPPPEVWVTYGNFVRYPSITKGTAAAYPDDVIATAAYREVPFNAGHPRTCYAWLAQSIPRSDLLINGQIPCGGYDSGVMFALFELAGGRLFFIPDILAVYNRSNPINVDKQHTFAYQQNITQLYRTKAPRYAPLHTAPQL